MSLTVIRRIKTMDPLVVEPIFQRRGIFGRMTFNIRHPLFTRREHLRLKRVRIACSPFALAVNLMLGESYVPVLDMNAQVHRNLS